MIPGTAWSLPFDIIFLIFRRIKSKYEAELEDAAKEAEGLKVKMPSNFSFR